MISVVCRTSGALPAKLARKNFSCSGQIDATARQTAEALGPRP